MEEEDKVKYMKATEQYCREKCVFELLQRLKKELIFSNSETPLDYLITKLSKPLVRRVIIIGPPGCNRSKYVRKLADSLKFGVISSGACLARELQDNKQGLKEKIETANKEYKMCKGDDETVWSLVKEEIKTFEEKSWSYVLDGYPRTKIQARYLFDQGITFDQLYLFDFPSKIATLNIKTANLDYLKKEKGLYDSEIDDICSKIEREYRYHEAAVKAEFGSLLKVVTVDAMKYEMSEAQIAAVKFKMHHRLKVSSPLREPRLVVVGPPGAGRQTYSRMICNRYGMVHVSVRELTYNEIIANTPRGTRMKECIDNGEPISDSDIIPLVTARLAEGDCKMYGWVLDGYPSSLKQIHTLKHQHLAPSAVLLLECIDAKCLDRTEFKRVDPISGLHYNLKFSPPKDSSVVSRLQQEPQNVKKVILKRLKEWHSFEKTIEKEFDSCLLELATDGDLTSCTEQLFDLVTI